MIEPVSQVALVTGWREALTVAVAVAIIYLAYLLKERLSTQKHVHITRQEVPKTTGDEEEAPG